MGGTESTDPDLQKFGPFALLGKHHLAAKASFSLAYKLPARRFSSGGQ